MHFQLRIDLTEEMGTADVLGRTLIDIGEELHGYGVLELEPVARAIGIGHAICDPNGAVVGRWQVVA